MFRPRASTLVTGLLLTAIGCRSEPQQIPPVPEADMSVADMAVAEDGPSSDGATGGRPPPVLTAGASNRFLLRGTMLTPGGPMVGELLVESTNITCVAPSCAAMPGAVGATVIQTSGIILPGLIDAHNHGLFNIFDEGDWNPGKFFNSHNDWTANDARYKQVVDAKQYLNSEGTSPVDYRCEIDKYTEIKALIAGTTSFTLAPGAIELACYSSLVRTIDTARNGLGVDKLRTSISVPDNTTAQGICNAFTAGTANAYVVHVAEGINATARNEFATLESRAGGCLIAPQTTIVHGTALGTAEFTKMAAAGMRLVWSPKSNLFLYNDTTRIDLAIAAGVSTIALAPDWSLGGSINMLDELKVARQVSSTRWPGLLSSRRLFEMATIDAARALGVDAYVGSLEVGKRADLVLLSADPSQPYDAVIAAAPKNLELVMVDGRALYGEPVLKAAGPAAPGCEGVTMCGASKFLCVAETSTANKLNQTYADILQALKTGLADYDVVAATMGIGPFSPIAPLQTCK
ncbi:MAG TPA: amidohydrolase family protein [Pseudomonadota bacterium]|nr:amidohydrolase family protein [Pseudomonadota bacterium]